MMVVDLSYGPSLKASKPRVLWRGNYLAGAGSSCGMAGPTSANYDVTPDGERFLMIEDASSTAESERLRVVSNWSVELEKSWRHQSAIVEGRARPVGILPQPGLASEPESDTEESVIVLHHGDQIRSGRERSTPLEVSCPSLLNSGDSGCHPLDDAGVIKSVEALDRSPMWPE